jgi:hypothetical protein
MIFFCPRSYLPKFMKGRVKFTALMLIFTVSATFLSVFNPIFNAFALMTLALPTTYLLCKELQRIKTKYPKVYELGVRTAVLLSFAIGERIKKFE